MKLLLSFGLVLLSAALTVAGGDPDYYWREYTGKIPKDALLAVQDENGRKSYIGQVYIQGDGGMFVGQIYAGNKQMTVTGSGGKPGQVVHTRSEFIKILCSQNPQKFRWVQSSAENLNEMYYHLVEGGYENRMPGMLHVGKTDFEGKTKIGKVIGYGGPEGGRMYFANGNEERSKNSFKVLVYQQDNTENAPLHGEQKPVRDEQQA